MTSTNRNWSLACFAVLLGLVRGLWPVELFAQQAEFVSQHCVDCHNSVTQEAGLDLETLPRDLANAEHFRRWIKVFDRVSSGEMPPKDAPQPAVAGRQAFAAELSKALLAADEAALNGDHSSRLRRLTRSEYENTVRDLFQMPGIALAGNLPPDGSAFGFDKHADALDLSHVNLAKYLEAANHVLHLAIATRPQPPVVQKRRISLVNRGGFVAGIVLNGDGILLKNGQPDPEFPPAADQSHLDHGAHEQWGSFETGSSVGLFRHEDESVSPYFVDHVTVYPGTYRVRTSLWGFQWDCGKMLPGRGTEAARLSVVQLTGDGRGGQHPSYVLGYFNAPADRPQEHEAHVWLNHNELIGFNTSSLAPTANYSRKGRAMAFTGPGIVVDWLDIEGPLHEVWPPRSHSLIFGDLPMTEFRPEADPETRPPTRPQVRQLSGRNRPDPEPGLWTVQSDSPLVDADRLLQTFLPKLFRRPVADEIREQYVGIVNQRRQAGDTFESALRAACKVAMCSPDFLYHVEPVGELDQVALANRLSYFLWNSIPDQELSRRAAAGELQQAQTLHAEVERMLDDSRFQRFVDDFVSQWLKLRLINANDPDNKLYPEFSPYLQDSMVAETRAYFRSLLDQNLDVSHLVRSDFVWVNQKLATHYEMEGVTGAQMRVVPLPDGCPRGGLLTQAAILKVTANGTTTSPVPRGAFVIDRLLGEPPEPPPSSVAAIEPDVRGTTTIREQLAKHREFAVCASCHLRIDPPGFALESFDVIGGFRQRYRSIGEGDPADRGKIDPIIGISFKLGLPVDATGTFSGGQSFQNVREFQALLANETDRLLGNLARQLMIYATGREVRFSDRAAIHAIVSRTREQGGGLRTLLHEVVASPLFMGSPLIEPAGTEFRLPTPRPSTSPPPDTDRLLMTANLPPVQAIRTQPVPTESSPQKPITVSDSHTLTLRVTGLFMPERVEALKSLLADFPEVAIQNVDFDTAEMTLAYDPECDRFHNANPDLMVERIHDRIGQLSHSTLGAKAQSTTPRDKWERVEFPIYGLDCMACSLAVYQIMIRTEGVEQATANFREGKATAWIDPVRIDRARLVSVLNGRDVKTAKE